MEIGDYAYVETRLASLEVELAAKERREARFTLYSGLSNLIEFLPAKVKPFVEWWILRNDFENVKDAVAQMLGGVQYGFSRPFIRIERGALIGVVKSRNMHDLLDLLSSVFEDFKKEAFENLTSYNEIAFNLDKFYFENFNDRLPKSDEELARRLVALRADLLNLRLLKRVRDLKRFFLPYGLLSVNDIRDEEMLSERLFELYGVRSVDELKSYYRSICMNYGSAFAGVMSFIMLHEYSIGEV